MAESVQTVQGVDYSLALTRTRRFPAKLVLASDQCPLRFFYALKKVRVLRLKDCLQVQIRQRLFRAASEETFTRASSDAVAFAESIMCGLRHDWLSDTPGMDYRKSGRYCRRGLLTSNGVSWRFRGASIYLAKLAAHGVAPAQRVYLFSVRLTFHRALKAFAAASTACCSVIRELPW
jgi:hypothetical protein